MSEEAGTEVSGCLCEIDAGEGFGTILKESRGTEGAPAVEQVSIGKTVEAVFQVLELQTVAESSFLGMNNLHKFACLAQRNLVEQAAMGFIQ